MLLFTVGPICSSTFKRFMTTIKIKSGQYNTWRSKMTLVFFPPLNSTDVILYYIHESSFHYMGYLEKSRLVKFYTLFWVFVGLIIGIVWFWFSPQKQGIQRKRKSLILNSVTGHFWLKVECSFFSMFKHWICFYLYLQCISL